MFFQLFIGTVFLVSTLVMAAGGFWLMEVIADRVMPWATRPPHPLKLASMLIMSAIDRSGDHNRVGLDLGDGLLGSGRLRSG